MTLAELAPGKLAITFDGKLAVIVGNKPSNPKNSVLFKMRQGHTIYKGSPSGFKAVIGDVDLEAFDKVSGEAPDRHASETDNDFFLPKALKGVKKGDKIRIRSRRGEEVVTFNGYNLNRPKYPVSFTDSRGRLMKGGNSLVIGKVA